MYFCRFLSGVFFVSLAKRSRQWLSVCQPKAICWFGGNFSFDARFFSFLFFSSKSSLKFLIFMVCALTLYRHTHTHTQFTLKWPPLGSFLSRTHTCHERRRRNCLLSMFSSIEMHIKSSNAVNLNKMFYE